MNLLSNDKSKYSFFRKENAVFLNLIVIYSHTPQGCSSDAEAIVKQSRLKGTEIDRDLTTSTRGKPLTHYGQDKTATFRRRHVEIHFAELKCVSFA